MSSFLECHPLSPFSCPHKGPGLPTEVVYFRWWREQLDTTTDIRGLDPDKVVYNEEIEQLFPGTQYSRQRQNRAGREPMAYTLVW